ncbi:MAG: cytochrome c [Rhodospirillaceae bacterium]|nr:cytochrome c [Rhodospirillaceae bacterium]MBT5676512.1 cytochrome c [Rhodospirillaceae bacterium]MBT5778422.1 cytochrome c [Rhodospirillaceae bacterium]
MLNRLIVAFAIALVIGFIGPASAGEKEETSPAQVAAGAKSWADNCARCHNMRSPSEFNDYEWNVIVDHMRVRANLPGDVARNIKAFLEKAN